MHPNLIDPRLTPTLCEGWRLAIVRETGSTMTDALEFLKSGALDASHGFALQALSQTNGIGSKGRSWQSPNGNLMVSMIVDLKGRHHREIALVLALAVISAIHDFKPNAEIIHKMPNDLLIKGKHEGDPPRKIAGILTQDRFCHDGRCVTGLGVNTTVAPELPQRVVNYVSGCLHEIGINTPAIDFLSVVIGHFDKHLKAQYDDPMYVFRKLGYAADGDNIITAIFEDGASYRGAYGGYRSNGVTEEILIGGTHFPANIPLLRVR